MGVVDYLLNVWNTHNAGACFISEWSRGAEWHVYWQDGDRAVVGNAGMCCVTVARAQTPCWTGTALLVSCSCAASSAVLLALWLLSRQATLLGSRGVQKLVDFAATTRCFLHQASSPSLPCIVVICLFLLVCLCNYMFPSQVSGLQRSPALQLGPRALQFPDLDIFAVRRI